MSKKRAREVSDKRRDIWRHIPPSSPHTSQKRAVILSRINQDFKQKTCEKINYSYFSFNIIVFCFLMKNNADAGLSFATCLALSKK
jgi:hypothetical protein